MDAYLIYIDDWLSSGRIEEMDAEEERGYFRLLLRAAKEPDCGLPDDPQRLAIWSKLRDQWGKPTKDPALRFGATTSGEKILACFELKRDGRIYNLKALEVFEKYKATKEKRTSAANTRWDKSRSNAQAMQMHSTSNAGFLQSNADTGDVHNGYTHTATPLQCESNATRVGSELEDVVSTKEPTRDLDNSKLPKPSQVFEFPTNGTAPVPKLVPPQQSKQQQWGQGAAGSDSTRTQFATWLKTYTACGVPFNDTDVQDAEREWNRCSFEQQIQVSRWTKEYAEQDWREYHPLPANFIKTAIRDKPWTRTAVPAHKRPQTKEPRGLRAEEIV